ncbi:flavin reductase family protein [Paracoccus sp. JM45]|uniref:flavin reductase family protein n=1 Tax=Paracoccus sp. JM45 TaxID=2283626 RepID=UPI000E6C72DA|nr:flavin reductase family protein [Paracoccus sp. JM45]RJE78682.1 flavin reductase [Paracoccus sp. JM45]
MTPLTFPEGMRRLVAGVSLITVSTEQARFGLIATAVTSLSADPPSLLVCVNKDASIHAHLAEVDAFCVNVLSRNQQPIAERFASPVDRDTRFSQGEWTSLTTGAPALIGSQVSFDCRSVKGATHGTHTVFFGNVLQAAAWDDVSDPLLWHAGAFAALPQLETN